MKHFISILLLTAMLLSMVACNQSIPDISDADYQSGAIADNSGQNSAEESEPYLYIPRDYLSEWADREHEAYVTDTFNSLEFIGLPTEKKPSFEERDEMTKVIAERRKTAYLQTHSFPDSKNWGETTLAFSYVSVYQKNKRISYKNEEIGVVYNILSGKPSRVSYSRDYYMAASESSRQEGKKVVNSQEEALEFAKDYIRKNLDIGDDIDLYIPTYLHTYTSEDGRHTYEFDMQLEVKGIVLFTLYVEVDEYFGVVFCNLYQYSKESFEFYSDCIEYATLEESWTKVVASLESGASENPDILEIKDVKLYNCGVERGYVSIDVPTDYVYVPDYDKYGKVQYYSYLDKTGVDLYCEYTAVMADGTEKKGLNVVTVFIPIDWAEEFGEK